jgi:hypothetical protein
MNYETAFDTFGRLLGFCIIKINSGDFSFIKIYFELAKKFYSIFPEAKREVTHFRNFVIYGLNLKQYNFVEKFIRQNSEFLPEYIRNDLTNYLLADLYTRQGKIKEALALLSKINLTNERLKTETRHLYIIIYYETNELDSLFSLIDSSKHYFRNKHKGSLAFLKYTELLAKIKLNPDKTKLLKIQKELKTTYTVFNFWLQEKAEELEKQ